ncbi:MAG: hypothetical protein LBJ23_03425 [Tannerella sp.]|jgi:hypothetical protein|nr:hypothetical protein [Tannerella sp.]
MEIKNNSKAGSRRPEIAAAAEQDVFVHRVPVGALAQAVMEDVAVVADESLSEGFGKVCPACTLFFVFFLNKKIIRKYLFSDD